MATEPRPPEPLDAGQYIWGAFYWWIGAVGLLVLPWILLPGGIGASPMPYGRFSAMLLVLRIFAVLFLGGSLLAYRQWRTQMPEQTRPRNWGPTSLGGRRAGFWVLWGVLMLYGWTLLVPLGQIALNACWYGGPGAYVGPVVGELAISGWTEEDAPVTARLTLENRSSFVLPVNPGQVLGQLTVQTPDPELGNLEVPLGLDQLDPPASPTHLLARRQYSFVVPLGGRGAGLRGLPDNTEVVVTYTPQGALFNYVPLEVYRGPIGAVRH